MSSIDKLLVRGIRSFSPYDENIIEFYTPLTIIVGHNGAGKTTVIECLKYATTGDLPPNSKGGAFVHDPKVSRELEVKGQIKLKFKNVKGQTMVVTRSMQSTQKRSKLEQKTLESVLVTTDPSTGEQVSISSRCAEMDSEIPLQLGVSRAVLDNVLFCHQEDSFWPLSEPSVLKKKFDDIFAATKYTKALDAIKSLRKDYTAELKLEQQKLDFLKADREKMSKLQLEIEKNERRREEGLERIASLDSQIKSVQESIDSITAEIQALSSLESKMESVHRDINSFTQMANDLMAGMKVLEFSDEELNQKLLKITERTHEDETVQEKLKEQKCNIEAQINDVSKSLTIKNTAIGVKEAEIARLVEKAGRHNELMKTLCQNLSINAKNSVNETLDALKSIVEKNKEEMQNVVKSLKASEDEVRAQSQDCSIQLSTLTESKKMKRRFLEDAQKKLGIVIEQLSDIDSSRQQIEEVQAKILEEEVTLMQAKSYFEAANYEDRLVFFDGKRKGLEDELAKLNEKVASSNKFTEIRARFDLKKTDLNKKEEQVQRIYKDVKSDLEGFAGCTVAVEDAERECERLWRSKDRQMRALQERQDKTNQNASLSKSKLDHALQLMTKKEREISVKSKKIEQICGKEDFGLYFEEVEQELERLSKDITESLSSKSTYENFQLNFAKNKCCPLCVRSFDSKLNEELFSRSLSKLLDEIPTKAVSLQQRKKELEEKMGQLKGLRTASDDVDRLRMIELPELESEVRTLKDEANRTQNALDEINSEFSSTSLEEKKLQVLKKRCEEIGKLTRDIENIKGDVHSAEQELALAGVDYNSNDLQSEISEKQSEVKKINQESENLRGEMKAKQQDLTFRENRYRDLKEKLMKIKLSQSEATMLEQQRVEFESCILENKNELEALDKETEVFTERSNQLQTKLDQLISENMEKDNALKAKYNSLADQLKNLMDLNNELSVHPLELQENELKSLRSESSSIIEELRNLQGKLDIVNEEISSFSRVSSEAVLEERNLRDNIRYRELMSKVEEYRKELSRLQIQVGSFNQSSASSNLQKLELKQSELLGGRSGVYGELRQLDDHTQRLRQDLVSDYGGTEEDYRKQFIKFNATITAIEDLEKYAKALDQAIMKFHSYKMSEVNRIIREIWTATYQGADIDTIEIRADSEGAVGGRSYNYRVVMLKGDTELDMRGRSSAGQRVLASLIIRLALAETFGQHCGVLALDEPTTNLDRENIDSLANSLAEIIKMRGQQGNFQLIIITHDEEFVDLLGRHECADYYWRVVKDERQYSTIERQSFAGIPG